MIIFDKSFVLISPKHVALLGIPAAHCPWRFIPPCVYWFKQGMKTCLKSLKRCFLTCFLLWKFEFTLLNIFQKLLFYFGKSARLQPWSGYLSMFPIHSNFQTCYVSQQMLMFSLQFLKVVARSYEVHRSPFCAQSK